MDEGFGGRACERRIRDGTIDAFNHTLPKRDDIDLAATCSPNKVLTIRTDVNNVFDIDPPIANSPIAGTDLPNTCPTYDLLGRRLLFGVSARF